jgi:hypothetical protein
VCMCLPHSPLRRRLASVCAHSVAFTRALLQGHPNMPWLATSGIETAVKLWTPEGSKSLCEVRTMSCHVMSLLVNCARVMSYHVHRWPTSAILVYCACIQTCFSCTVCIQARFSKFAGSDWCNWFLFAQRWITIQTLKQMMDRLRVTCGWDAEKRWGVEAAGGRGRRRPGGRRCG